MPKLSLVLFLFVVICSLAAAEKYALLVQVSFKAHPSDCAAVKGINKANNSITFKNLTF